MLCRVPKWTHCVPVMPNTLSETEVWDKLHDTLRSAIQHCGDLANLPAMGPTYRLMITELAEIDGAARQFGTLRGDARWNAFGYEMESFHQRIGDAIRAVHARKIFLHMQAMMQGALDEAIKMKDAKTGRRGPILPKPKPAPLRSGRPVYVKRDSGLIMPAGA